MSGPAFVVYKGDEEIEVDDTPENRKKAKAKGYEIHEILTSPKGEEAIVPEHLAEKAIKKGYQFSDTYVKPHEREPLYEPWESAIKGAADAATMGIDDEAWARAQSILGGKNYKTERATQRAIKKFAEEDNPEEYHGGQIGGAIASGLAMEAIPPLAAAKGASLAGRIGRGAAEGAALGGASAYGDSESDDLGEQLKDTSEGALLGGAIGGAVPAATHGIARGGSKAMRVIPGAESLLEGFYKKFGEIPDHIAERIKKDPDLVERGRNYGGNDIASDRVADATNRLRKQQAALVDDAWDILVKRDKAQPASPLIGQSLANLALPVAKANDILGPVQKAQKVARDKLRDAMNDVARAKNYGDLKRAVMKIDANIDWTSADNTVANKVLQQFRTAIDDRLKKAVPAYAEAMLPVEAHTKAIEELQNKFGLKKGSTTVEGDIEPRFYPTDRTTSQIESQSTNALGQHHKGHLTRKMLKDHAPEVLNDIEARAMEKFMGADIGRGSRTSVAMGGLVGAVAGLFGAGWLAPAAGAALGFARDKMGREFAAQGIARIGMASARAGEKVGGKSASMLEKAAQRGAKAYIVAHQILMDRDPEYKRAYEEEMKNDE